MKTVLFNVLIFTPLLISIDAFTQEFRYKYSIEDWPTFWVIVKQFIFFQLVEDFTFYWSHRFLHHPKLYWIHKKHHEYNISISLAATYAHPLEFFLGNGLPFSLGYMILSYLTDVHLITIFVWTAYRYLETTEGHSGYEFPWAQFTFVPFKLNTNYHDFHHTMNSGNFGSQYCFWDTVMGTNQVYKEHLKKKGEKSD